MEDTRLYMDVAHFPSVTIETIYKCILLFYAKAHQYFKIKILRFDESLYACNAPFFKRKFYELIGIYLTKSPIIPCEDETKNIYVNEVIYKYVILDCSPFNYIDTVGVKLLIQVGPRNRKRKHLHASYIFVDISGSEETRHCALSKRVSMYVKNKQLFIHF